VRDLDVEAVYPVVFDAQIRDTRARAFPRLQVDQELAGVIAQRAQLIELRVISSLDHVAIARRNGWLQHQPAP